MKKLKLTLVSVVIAVSGSLLGMQVAGAGPYVNVMSGTNCSAANLNQAGQGMSWSQAGIVNNSSNPLFVVCPLDWIFGPGQAWTEPYVLARFPGSGTIACTVRSQSFLDNSYVSVAINITSGQITGNPNTGLGGAVLARSGSNNTVVCALDPGEGINALWYE